MDRNVSSEAPYSLAMKKCAQAGQSARIFGGSISRDPKIISDIARWDKPRLDNSPGSDASNLSTFTMGLFYWKPAEFPLGIRERVERKQNIAHPSTPLSGGVSAKSGTLCDHGNVRFPTLPGDGFLSVNEADI
jgi:hypothetical protein